MAVAKEVTCCTRLAPPLGRPQPLQSEAKRKRVLLSFAHKVMGRLSTQPSQATAIPLRSGFFALPLDSATSHLYARLHSAQLEVEEDDVEEEAAEEESASKGKQLFITGLPLGVTDKSLKATLKQLYPSNKILAVHLLPSTASTPSLTLLSREMSAASVDSSTIDPLFPSATASSSSSALPPPPSALVTFTSVPALPPAPYPAATPLLLPTATSYLTTSSQRHALARPHLSTIIAHSDTWMVDYDRRKLATVPAHYTPIASTGAPLTATQKKKARVAAAKAAKRAGAQPVPGSAAYALQQHQAQVARAKDREDNPDEVKEGEWTLVTGGGRHGKSLLPTGVKPNLAGYGEGTTVKVVKAKPSGRRKEAGGSGSDEEGGEEEYDQGIKKIVGDGFYSFVKNQQRRDGTFSPTLYCYIHLAVPLTFPVLLRSNRPHFPRRQVRAGQGARQPLPRRLELLLSRSRCPSGCASWW